MMESKLFFFFAKFIRSLVLAYRYLLLFCSCAAFIRNMLTTLCIFSTVWLETKECCTMQYAHDNFVTTRINKKILGVTPLTISDHDHFMKVIDSLSVIGTLCG